MEQFTASEVVTKLRERFTSGNSIPVSDVRLTRAEFDVIADLLEERERAVPVAYAEFADNGCVRMWSRGYEERLPGTRMVPLYAHPAPSDTERLAEALRNLVSEWVAIADDGDATLEDSTIGYRACANRLSAMLAAHSAQAPQPAASVTDAMKRAFEHLASIGYPKNARGNYDKDGEWTFSDAVPRDVDAREVSAAFHALEAALAAQENPNG